MGDNPGFTRDAHRNRAARPARRPTIWDMTTGPADARARLGVPEATAVAVEQRFTDALCGPDGTWDPAVLMPVLQVYPDALSAPMPDAMVAGPAVDPADLLAAARARAAAELPTPVQARLAAQRAWADSERVAQPGRRGADPGPARRPAPAAWSAPDPHRAASPTARPAARPGMQRPPGAAPRPVPTASAPAGSGGRAGRPPTPAEVADLLRTTFGGMAQGMTQGITNGLTRGPNRNLAAAARQHQPAAHAPTPPLPRTTRRRNRGSSIWAVLVFLVVIAFASGLAQQILTAISGLFNR